MTSIIKKYKNPLIYLLTIIFVFLLWLVLSLLIDSSLILPSPVSSIKEIFYFFADTVYAVCLFLKHSFEVRSFVQWFVFLENASAFPRQNYFSCKVGWKVENLSAWEYCATNCVSNTNGENTKKTCWKA